MKRSGIGLMSSQFEVMNDSNPKLPVPIKRYNFCYIQAKWKATVSWLLLYVPYILTCWYVEQSVGPVETCASLLTYLLTPWCRVLLEKLTGLQLVKKFPAFLWKPKVHYRTQKRPQPVLILGQPNPVPIPTSHILEIHPNIIHPSTPRSPQWSLSFRFPHQDPIRPPYCASK